MCAAIREGHNLPLMTSYVHAVILGRVVAHQQAQHHALLLGHGPVGREGALVKRWTVPLITESVVATLGKS